MIIGNLRILMIKTSLGSCTEMKNCSVTGKIIDDSFVVGDETDTELFTSGEKRTEVDRR